MTQNGSAGSSGKLVKLGAYSTKVQRPSLLNSVSQVYELPPEDALPNPLPTKHASVQRTHGARPGSRQRTATRATGQSPDFASHDDADYKATDSKRRRLKGPQKNHDDQVDATLQHALQLPRRVTRRNAKSITVIDDVGSPSQPVLPFGPNTSYLSAARNDLSTDKTATQPEQGLIAQTPPETLDQFEKQFMDYSHDHIKETPQVSPEQVTTAVTIPAAVRHATYLSLSGTPKKSDTSRRKSVVDRESKIVHFSAAGPLLSQDVSVQTREQGEHALDDGGLIRSSDPAKHNKSSLHENSKQTSSPSSLSSSISEPVDDDIGDKLRADCITGVSLHHDAHVLSIANGPLIISSADPGLDATAPSLDHGKQATRQETSSVDARSTIATRLSAVVQQHEPHKAFHVSLGVDEQLITTDCRRHSVFESQDHAKHQTSRDRASETVIALPGVDPTQGLDAVHAYRKANRSGSGRVDAVEMANNLSPAVIDSRLMAILRPENEGPQINATSEKTDIREAKGLGARMPKHIQTHPYAGMGLSAQRSSPSRREVDDAEDADRTLVDEYAPSHGSASSSCSSSSRTHSTNPEARAQALWHESVRPRHQTMVDLLLTASGELIRHLGNAEFALQQTVSSYESNSTRLIDSLEQKQQFALAQWTKRTTLEAQKIDKLLLTATQKLDCLQTSDNDRMSFEDDGFTTSKVKDAMQHLSTCYA